MDRESVVEREKDAFGGVEIGSAFFGGLTGMRFHRRVDRAGLGR